MMKKLCAKIQYGPSFRSAQVEKREYRLPASCAGLAGRTLLFLSDIHLSEYFPETAVRKLIDQIEPLNPDMILLGGDYAESPQWQEQFFEMFSRLSPPLGTYGVFGNNDRECFPDGYHPLIQAAAKSGAAMLVDQTIQVDTGAGLISIAGLDEFRHAKPLKHALFSETDASSLRILLAHYPQSVSRYMKEYPSFAPHLGFSGHTHGGQFRLGSLTPFSIGFEHLLHGEPLPLVSGWTNIGPAEILVSPGLGTSRLPIRINAAPAIHLIRLAK